MRIEEEIKLDFSDVLIRPKRSTLSSRKEVDIGREFTFKHSGAKFSGVPIIAANMDGVGTFSMAKTFHNDGNGLTVALRKHYSIEELILYYMTWGGQDVWYGLGSSEHDLEKLRHLKRSQPGELGNVTRLCLDVANGYTQAFVDSVKRLRDEYPQDTIMAGNVVTGEMVEELILAGADLVKVGIGPGSVCTTRKMTGVGYPQLSAVIECADAAHGLGGLICSDGGCTVPGDLAKAFGAGADFVMLGGMLAGHAEAEGEFVDMDKKAKPGIECIGTVSGHNKYHSSEIFVEYKFENQIVRAPTTGDINDYIPNHWFDETPVVGKSKIRFYGMSSDTAQMEHEGKMREYRASEGKTVDVLYRGAVRGTIQEILGGLRSACTYVGAVRLKELTKRTTFVRVSRQLNTVFGNS